MRYSNETTYKLGGTILGETDKAIRFRTKTMNDLPYDAEEVGVAAIQWYPISQVVSITRDPNPDGEDSIKVKEWILSRKEMI